MGNIHNHFSGIVWKARGGPSFELKLSKGIITNFPRLFAHLNLMSLTEYLTILTLRIYQTGYIYQIQNRIADDKERGDGRWSV